MKISELVFVGIKGSVVALERKTGKLTWSTRLKGYDFVNVLFDGDRLLASTFGEVFCVDALSGKVLWHNPLRGYGRGLSGLATPTAAGASAITAAEVLRQQQAQAVTTASTAG
jgi:outer membrane protein assembly factor BamB